VPRRGIGEVALEKIRALANERFDGDLIKASDAGNDKLSIFVQTLQAIQAEMGNPMKALETALRLTHYREYIAEKYNKKNEKEKALTKLENLERFAELLKGLVEESEMTLEDVVFQLSIDRQTDNDESGKVVISTIHCSPPDEPVLTTKGSKPIASLDPETDRLYSYYDTCNQLARGSTRHRGRAYEHSGYPFTVKTRYYKGQLVVIDTEESHTRVTPEHRVRVAFHKNFYDKWVVYLMRRGNWWRVGSTRSMSKPYVPGGVLGRLASEKADCAWILDVFNTKEEAVMAEAKYQVLYGIPAMVFEAAYHEPRNNQEREKVRCTYQFHEGLRSAVSPRATQLLTEKGFLVNEPLYAKKGSKGYKIYNGSFFTTVAANLMDGYMVVPVAQQSDFEKPGRSPRPLLARVRREPYEGSVFSLDVVPNHYYLSGGMVVHNSAKGLEWNRVYVTNLYEGSIPHKFSMGNAEEIEEERRLFYVAATRARDTLVLCIPGMVQSGPNTQTVAPSRFLFEIGIH